MIPVFVPVISYMSRVYDSLKRQSLLDEWYGFKCYTHKMNGKETNHPHQATNTSNIGINPRPIRHSLKPNEGPITRANRTVFEQDMLSFP